MASQIEKKHEQNHQRLIKEDVAGQQWLTHLLNPSNQAALVLQVAYGKSHTLSTGTLYKVIWSASPCCHDLLKQEPGIQLAS